MLHNITEFQNFFSESKSFFGNSQMFTNIQTLVAKLSEMNASNPIISESMAKERLELINQIHQAGSEYLSERAGAHTAKGKERFEAVKDLVNFCTKEYSALTNPDRVRYLRGKSVQELHNKVEKTEMDTLKAEVEQYRSMPFTEENILNRAKAMDRYVVASKLYKEDRVIPSPAYEQQMETVCEEYKKLAENARDLRTVHRMISDQKGWDDLDEIEIPEITVEQKGEMIGANINQRMKVTHNGVKGFFTSEVYISGDEENFHRIIEQEENLEDRKLLQEIEPILASLKNYVIDAGGEYEKESDDNTNVSDYFVHIFNKWEAETDQEKKELYYNLIGRPTMFKEIDTALKELEQMQSFENDAEKAKHLYEKLETLGKLHYIPEEMQGDIKENPEKLFDFTLRGLGVEHRIGGSPQKKLNHYTKCRLKYQATMYAENSKEAQMLNQMANDEALIYKYTSMVKKTHSLTLANDLVNMGTNDKKLKELSKRNVLSSRVAELLGVGSMMAHSEKMNVKINGKVVPGTFMEFAEGIDPKTQNENEMRMLAETVVESNASLNKDIFAVEVLDYLCYQVDRHGNNMFYKLSDVHTDGKRRVTGITLIDNDLAFGEDNAIDKASYLVNLDHVIFIDKDMANKIRKIDRSTLETISEGILSNQEMDAFEERLNKLKTHLEKNMVEIEQDDWDLDQSKAQKYGDRSQKYLDALAEYEKSMKGEVRAWEVSHKDVRIRNVLKSGIQSRNAEKAKEAYILSGVKDLFEEAEGLVPERKSESEIKKEVEKESQAQREARRDFQAERAARDAKFDQIMKAASKEPSNKENSKTAPIEPAVKEEPRVEKAREKMSFSEFAGQQRASERGIKIGAHREKAAFDRQIEKMGFEEITKDDIEKANNKTKKPIIGGHRKK